MTLSLVVPDPNKQSSRPIVSAALHGSTACAVIHPPAATRRCASHPPAPYQLPRRDPLLHNTAPPARQTNALPAGKAAQCRLPATPPATPPPPSKEFAPTPPADSNPAPTDRKKPCARTRSPTSESWPSSGWSPQFPIRRSPTAQLQHPFPS